MSQPAIVIDNGSGSCKMGYAGEEKPQVEIPCLVGYSGASFSIGNEAKEKIDSLEIKYPLTCGSISNWEEMEKIWNYGFSQLGVNPSGRDILLCDPLFLVERTEFEKHLYQIFLEKLGANSIKIECSGLCSMEATGKTTGLVIDSGYSHTSFHQVIDGTVFVGDAQDIQYGGKNITEYLIKSLKNQGIVDLNGKSNFFIADELKKNLCYVAQDFYGELNGVEEAGYTLPDGREIKLKKDRIECVETLFDLTMVGFDREGSGLSQGCKDAIDKSNIMRRKDLYSYILIIGGNSLFKGFDSRLAEDLKKIVPPAMAKRITVDNTLNDKEHVVFKGAAIMANINDYKKKWINQKVYNEKYKK